MAESVKCIRCDYPATWQVPNYFVRPWENSRHLPLCEKHAQEYAAQHPLEKPPEKKELSK